MTDTPFKRAIKALGGQIKAAALLQRSQSTISSYVTANNPPADICMRIEVATGGEYRAEDMRPDLAAVFKEFREGTPPTQPQAAA